MRRKKEMKRTSSKYLIIDAARKTIEFTLGIMFTYFKMLNRCLVYGLLDV